MTLYPLDYDQQPTDPPVEGEGDLTPPNVGVDDCPDLGLSGP